MSVRFDTARCINALHVQLVKAIKKAQQEYLNEIISGVKQPEARGDWEEGEVEDAAWIIAAKVVGGAWAVMDNYGRGSLMDTSNPALEAYRQSELWNPARPDLYIRGRPPGTYTDIFGRQRTSTGRAVGRNLEGLGEEFAPWPPSKALQVATQVMEKGRFREIIQEAIDSFPWGDFIIATPD